MMSNPLISNTPVHPEIKKLLLYYPLPFLSTPEEAESHKPDKHFRIWGFVLKEIKF